MSYSAPSTNETVRDMVWICQVVKIRPREAQDENKFLLPADKNRKKNEVISKNYTQVEFLLPGMTEEKQPTITGDSVDQTLRPTNWDDYVGQDKIKKKPRGYH